MKILIDSGLYAPSNGKGYIDYTKYVLDGSISVVDSVNVPTLTTFQLSALDNTFVVPSRSSYVKIVSEIYSGGPGFITNPPTSINVTVPGSAYPWISNGVLNTQYAYTVPGGTSPISYPITVGKTVVLTYISGLVSVGAGFGSWDANGIPHSSGNNPPHPAQYINSLVSNGGSLIGGFADANGNLVAPPFYVGDGPTIIGPAPAAATQLLIGVNDDVTYSDNSGSWLINIQQLNTGAVLATGFVTNAAEPTYLGLNQNLKSQNYQQLTFNIQVTSDEWLLNCQAIPYIPAFVNQTDSAILAGIAEALMPGFFTFSNMASGTLVPYYQYDPTQTWSDVAKTFADANRFYYRVQDKKITYQPFGGGTTVLGLAYDETTQKERQIFPEQMQTQIVSVPPVNDCIVIGDIEPQNNVDCYFVGDGFTSNFQLAHQVFQGTSSNLLEDDWTEASFSTGTWIVNDPENTMSLADSNGNALGALNIVQKGTTQAYSPFANATFLQAVNGIELGGGLNLQHGQFVFNDTASGGGGVVGGIFENANNFSPANCLAGFQIESQPSLGSFTVVSVQATGAIMAVALQVNGINTTLAPGNVFSCAGFGAASWLNGQSLFITSIVQYLGNFVITATPQNPGIIPGNYGPTADAGTITFGANAAIVTASGAAGIYIYPLYNGSVTGTPVVSQPNHQYVLQTWVGAEAPNRFTRPYKNLTQTATYGAQNLTASGTISWVVTDVNLGLYVVQQQFPLFGLFPAAPPPVVTKFSASHLTLPPFGIYVLLSGLDLNVSINYTVLSLPPQGYLTVQSLTGASGGNLPWLPSQLTPAIPYQLGFGMVNQTAQISLAGEAFELSFYTDDIPSVGARIRFQSWSAGQSIARVRDLGAIAFEGRISGDSGVRSAIMNNLSPLPRTSDECEAAAGAAILDREYPQWQGSYTVQTMPFGFETLFSPSMYDYPHTGMFFWVNSPTRGVSGQNFFVNNVRMQVVETRGEVLTIAVSYGPDLYLEKLLPVFLEREQNILAPTQTVPPPNPITLPQVLNAHLPTLNSALVTTISNSLTGNFIVVDLSGGTEPNALTSNATLLSIGATGCEVRYVDNGWGTSGAGRVGIFTVDKFILPRTVRDQAFYVRGINGSVFSRFSKEFRIVYPLIPSSPALVSTNNTSIVFDYAGDVRDIYGIEVRVPSVSGVTFVQFAPGIPEDTISEFTRAMLPGTGGELGNATAYYGTIGTNGVPWQPKTAYPPGTIVQGNNGGTNYQFQLQTPVLPTIAAQNGTPMPNTNPGDYVNLYYWDTSWVSNPGIFVQSINPVGATPSAHYGPLSSQPANAHVKANSLLFNIGTGGDSKSTMINFVLNQAGEVVSASVPWGGANQRYSMSALFALNVPIAGTYFMGVVHDDGFFFGINNGATQVSGPTNTFHPNTPLNGYPVLGGNDNNTSGSPFLDNYSIHFPTAGLYFVEMCYFNFINEQTFVVQFGDPTGTIGTAFAPIPVPLNSFPSSMSVVPVWPAGAGAIVIENDNGAVYNGPFGTYGPLGGALPWKNIGAAILPAGPPFQYQAGDIVFLTCPSSSDFSEIVIVSNAGTNPDYYFNWFDYGGSNHVVGTPGVQGNVGTSELVVRPSNHFSIVSGSIDVNGIATVTTSPAHGLNTGQFVILGCGYISWPGGSFGTIPTNGAVFCGIQFITGVPAGNQLQFQLRNNPYPGGLPSVQLTGLGAFFPENPSASGGVIVQRPVFAPADLVVDLTQPDIADVLETLQATVPGGRISGLEAVFFNLTWDYSAPTVVPSFTVPSLTGILVDETTQQVLWGLAPGSGTPDGYRIEVTNYSTGQLQNKYTIDHISNPELLTQYQMSPFDFLSASGVIIKVTPFDTLGDGIPITLTWPGSVGSGGTGGGGLTIVVGPPLTATEPIPNLISLGIADFLGDSGTGGVRGTVPAPLPGSTAAHEFLSASGNWQTVPPPPLFIGDTGFGGVSGSVPAPPAGSAAAHEFLSASGNWASIPIFTGDTGFGGVSGAVPAPPAGSSALGEFLSASGTWAVVPVPSGAIQPYVIGCTLMGTMPGSGAIIVHPFSGLVGGGTTAYNFGINMLGSEAFLMSPAAATVTLNIYKNSVLIGTITFSAGAHYGTITVSTASSFTGGGSTPDVIIVVTPITPDTTAQNLGITLRGTRAYNA
jgi:hypothetical protein